MSKPVITSAAVPALAIKQPVVLEILGRRFNPPGTSPDTHSVSVEVRTYRGASGRLGEPVQATILEQSTHRLLIQFEVPPPWSLDKDPGSLHWETGSDELEITLTNVGGHDGDVDTITYP